MDGRTTDGRTDDGRTNGLIDRPTLVVQTRNIEKGESEIVDRDKGSEPEM